MKLCQIEARAGASRAYTDAGRYWFWFGWNQTVYCHGQTPNGGVPDCVLQSLGGGLGMVTARSGHPGGVNVLMGDGSCRWMNSSVDLAIWRAYGTRNGAELVD